MPIEDFGEIGEKLRRATVFVTAGRGGNGSGVILKSDGAIVTNAHVAAREPLRVQFWDGASASAKLVLRDPERDLAILRVARTNLPFIQFADSDRIRVGELAIAVGNPMGFIGALTTGVVHAVGRVPGLGPRKWVLSDVRLAPGNSGGPLANAHGHLLGINTMIAAGMGLAIPSNVVSPILSRLERSRHSRSTLGISARSVEIPLHGKQQFGLLLLEITPDTPAHRASLIPGDILLGANDKLFAAIDDFERLLDGDDEKVVRLQFVRGDRSKLRTVAIRLGEQRAAA
jgi:serine protease Do